MEQTSINRRYLLANKLGEGGMGAVYRAIDRLTNETVAYKQVHSERMPSGVGATTDVDIQAMRMALAREFEVVANLKHPYIISVQDYGFDNNRQPYFTMAMLHKPRSLTEAGQGQSLRVRIDLLVQFVQALSYLHRRKVIHCDLKPDNVLVNQDGTVQVVDFGLATLQSQRQDEDDEVAGTLAYMAPEVMQGEGVSFAADMYAVGVMAYELLLGTHPYDMSNLNMLIQNVLFTEPDYDKVHDFDWFEELTVDLPDNQELPDVTNSELATAVEDLLHDLLAKESDERLSNAEQVIQRLVSAFRLPAPEETVEIRESYLQAAEFIGREQEIETLTAALNETIRETGSSWLLAGESGVGKSRMVNELRTIALVRGMLVLRGQELETAGQGYALWQNVLQNLILNVEINALEASILKPIMPNIGDLLNQEITDPPPLEPKQVKERLIGMIVSLFRRVDRPIMLFLEDLHWTTENLDLLQRLNSLADEIKLLIVGTFRSDERPHLLDDLPSMQVIKLERLDRDDVERLAVSMMGISGSNPQLLDFIQSESEGNTFFLVEILRALAESAGQLSKIATMEIPTDIITGGIQKVIQNRLTMVPSAMHPLLEFAAIMGRQLDLPVLSHLITARDLQLDLEHWLTTCINFAILDKQDDQWRFAHDRLRQAMRDTVDESAAPALHNDVALAIEALHKPEEKAVALAYHWGAAGDNDKERIYATIAGEQAIATSSYDTARRYLTRAAELETDPEKIGMLRYQLGEAYRFLSDFDAAVEQYELAKSQTGRSVQLALRGLGQVHLDKGEHAASIPFLEESLAAARAHDDKVNESFTLYGISLANQYAGNMEKAMEVAQQALDAANQTNEQRAKSMALYILGLGSLQMGGLETGQAFLKQAYQIDHAIGHRRGEAFSRMYVGVSSIMQGQYMGGLPYIIDAQAIAADIGDRRLESITLLNLGQAYHLLGEHERNIEMGLRAINVFQEIGDKRHAVLSMSNVSQSYLLMGQYDEARHYIQQVRDMSADVDYPFALGIALNNLGQINYLQADYDAAMAALQDCEQVATEKELADILRRCYGHQAEVAIAREDYELALQKAERGLENEGDDDPYLAPMMKATALLHLKRDDEAKTYIAELTSEIEQELETTPEKHPLFFVKAYAMAMQLLFTNPADVMQAMMTVNEVYQNAIDAQPYKGLLQSEALRLQFLIPLDTMGAVTHIGGELQNAQSRI